MLTTLTLDLETTTKIHLGRKASPFSTDNWIVASGFKLNNSKCFGTYYSTSQTIDLPDLSNVDVLVGFNLAFDLQYLWHYPEIQQFFKDGGMIWDCQLAEYIIRGMTSEHHYPNLNDTAIRYGGTGKIDAVKELWNAGVDTPDIPQDLLMDYLLGNGDDIDGDIDETYTVYLAQMKLLESFPEQTYINLKNRMESRLATIEMEVNGLYINPEIAERLQRETSEELGELNERLLKYIPPLPEGCIFKWSSVYDKSYLIFGGVKKYQKWKAHHDENDKPLYCKKTIKQPILCPDTNEQLRFKSGKKAGELRWRNVDVDDLDKPKGAQCDHFFEFPRQTIPQRAWASTLTDGDNQPIYSTAADIITELSTRNIPFLKDLARRAKVSKDLSTYYYEENETGSRKGMLTKVGTDNIIHHNLNHTSTVTGRMSSSNPNLQNIPRKGTSKVKQMFTSRFGDDGYIVEMDYSALEVYVMAVLSGDTNMLKMLNDGVDFHCMRLSKKLGEPYEDVLEKCKDENHPQHTLYDSLRTSIKAFSFQLAYGAGAAAIAKDTGMSVDEVKGLMQGELELFPDTALFDDDVKQSIIDTYQPTGENLYIDGKMCPQGSGHYFSPTGSMYKWVEHEAPEFLKDRGQLTGFSPTERKNYPIQGEGGFIMQTMLGCLWRWFLRNNHWDGKALLINTVHDSCYLDIHKSVVHDVLPGSIQILSAVRRRFKSQFNIETGVDFNVDAEIGKSMASTKGYKTETIYND